MTKGQGGASRPFPCSGQKPDHIRATRGARPNGRAGAMTYPNAAALVPPHPPRRRRETERAEAREKCHTELERAGM